MEKLVDGLKSISLRLYAFAGSEAAGAAEFHRRIARCPTGRVNPAFTYSFEATNDGIPYVLTVTHANGEVANFTTPGMSVGTIVEEIESHKRVIEMAQWAKEYEEPEPDPLEEIVAQELERRKKKKGR
eukprot:CAMPEP_0119138928 /NCGR_PEP_ID=MMETSP1310-20130426/26589_1 /TAXON_ID=464262 /ORGANISM="Genus nov. species nov., Strain RCC2339" /LENGTH=127 /DNA_ID=CAMNT_0007130175 /DNA_START=92 /DNA_END=475 /DNA_ORIENTATION=-